MKLIAAVCFCIGINAALTVNASDLPPRMVLILDDLGVNAAQGRAALALPGPITYAVLPFTPDAISFSNAVEITPVKEVILHAPMENLARRPLGPGGLYPHQTEAEFKRVLNKNLDSLPMVQGLNNHMGSLLTQLEQPMRWVMDVALERDLFFIDSRTTADTQAANMARKANVPMLERDIFLDHEIDSSAIERQFLLAIEKALTQGTVVVIGHPYPETLEYLSSALPLLDELGIQRVTASAYFMQEADLKRLSESTLQVASASKTVEPASSIVRLISE